MDTKLIRQYFFLFFLSIELYGCLNAGTHGSIKVYEFIVSKQVLQQTVEKIIGENIYIHRDTTGNNIIDQTNGKNDTLDNNYYNDGKRYVSIKIENEGLVNYYTFQYSGSEEYWDTARQAYISIAYAFDENGNGGSDGEIDKSLMKKLVNLFERELINKVENELKIKHTPPRSP